MVLLAFPELAIIVEENIMYAKSVKVMAARQNGCKVDFFEILAQEVEPELKEAAVISMGTEISETDMYNMKDLCDEVVSISEYKGQLYDYLKSRMNTIAPNLTGLMNVAKQRGSTVGIIGAEKSIFRDLKTKDATPNALAIRYDALAENQDKSLGLENRAKIDARLRILEGKDLGRSAGSAKGKPKIEAYDNYRKKSYNPSELKRSSS
ncbi:hypothetical protein ACFE04_017226 [Oxalis oulophora]